jgi:hypothetical protein
MLQIARLADHPLQWTQPSMMRQQYELRTGDALVATLKFRSAWGTFATAESGDGCWTFKRIGFWQNKASIRVCGSEADLAIFQNNTWSSGGSLAFADGPRFNATTNFWMTNYEFRAETDEPLVRFRHGGVFRDSARVEVLPPARTLPELPLLVLFGWYLVLMLSSDAGGAAAVIAATSG